MEALKKEESHPVFLDGLQLAFLRYDVKNSIDKMKKVLTVEERTKVLLLLLR
jgi:hypothetical protein